MVDRGNPGLFLVMMDVPGDLVADFNRLYDTGHLAHVVAVPGVVAGQRFQLVDGEGPRYQAIYDLTSPDVTSTPEFAAMVNTDDEWSQRIRPRLENLQRLTFTQIHPPAADTSPAPRNVGGVLLVGLRVPAERDEEFNVWYNTEHIPYLSAVPGVLRARRFAAVNDPKQYLAVYELADPDVPQTDAFKQAAGTPWTNRHRPSFQFWLRARSRALSPVLTAESGAPPGLPV